MIPETNDLTHGLKVFDIFNRHLNNLFVESSCQIEEISDLLKDEPMKFFTPCMIIKRIAELLHGGSRFRNHSMRQHLLIEAKKIAATLSRCFEGNELLFSDEVVRAYQSLVMQLHLDIK